jgi:hypothetical protein
VASDLQQLSGRRDLIPYGCCGVKPLGQVFQAVVLVLVVCGHAGAARRLVAVRRRGDLG